ncbi:hypothetical protein ACA910_009910 [Epithemia clementina (nom. ined.)]
MCHGDVENSQSTRTKEGNGDAADAAADDDDKISGNDNCTDTPKHLNTATKVTPSNVPPQSPNERQHGKNQRQGQDPSPPLSGSNGDRPPHPYTNASFVSKLFFSWPWPLLKLGLERPLTTDDLADVAPVDSSQANFDHLRDLFYGKLVPNDSDSNNNKNGPGDLRRILFWDLISSQWFVQPLLMAAMMAKIVQSICLGKLIESFQRGDLSNEQKAHNYGWAAGIVACSLVTLMEHHHVFFVLWRKAMQYRIACIAAIYDKTLRLSSTHAVTTTTSAGRILNLASNDVERFFLTCLFISFLWWAPLQSIGIFVAGSVLVGVKAFGSGVAVLLGLFVPLQLYLSRRFAHYRSTIAAHTDDRVTFVAQAVRGARVLKVSGYEHRFLERIHGLRASEVHQLQAALRLKAANESVFFVTNIVVSLVVFLVHVYTTTSNEKLTTGNVFTVFTLVNVLQVELVKHVSIGTMATSECYVSVGRIQEFLSCPEKVGLPPSFSSYDNSNSNTPKPSSSSCLKKDTIEEKTATETTTKETRWADEPEMPPQTKPAIVMKNVSCQWNRVQHVRRYDDKLLDRQKKTPKNADTNNQMEQKAHAATAGSSSSSSSSSITDGMPLALDNVSVEFYHGTLTAIIGAVGSGKSALLQALVAELAVTSGSIDRNYQTLAYAAQDPWIMGGTIKDNILMGQELDEEWYHQVVLACTLNVDFEQLRDGDQTVVGDRGVQLSGGQRARVGLARALYQKAQVLILDDPLSAVDARVGRLLFQDAIMDLAVQKARSCVVLATHQHQYIMQPSETTRCVLVAAGGRVPCVGTYEECVAASQGKLTAHEADIPTADSMVIVHEKEDEKADDLLVADPNKEEVENVGAGADEMEVAKDTSSTKNNFEKEQDEKNLKGVVSVDTYADYIKAMGGYWIALVLFVLFVCTQGSVLVTVATMGRWAERDKEQQDDTDIVATVTSMSGLVVLLAVVRAFVTLELLIHASQTIHDRMAEAVLRAKIEFFDTNPLGRILNRFSADIGITDDMLPQTLFEVLVTLFIVFGAVVTTLTTLPFALVVLPFLVWYFARIRRIFVTSTRELKRLEGLARSPIFAMLSEALSGIATIRASGYIPYFQKKFREAHDAHTRIFFAFIACSRWIGFRMDSIVVMFLTAVSFLAVLVHNERWFDVDPSILGLSLSMLMMLANLFQYCIRQTAEVVNHMVSVERVLEFGKLESEAALDCDVDDELTAKGWPTAGKIEYDGVSVRYRASLPLALRKISFDIPAGARIGVVGRTGSGKSTVVQTLFRLLEPEEGRILIDGEDISKLGLHKVRTSISVIPQVPTLFSGCTVRENLDLFELHSDDEIRAVLASCHMQDVIAELPNGWNSVVSEGGSNFSVGQRQLLCLARALLAKNKILVLDEATASVDRRTDQLLQQALQESYHDGTILAVAHRLDTVIDYDFILVLGQGEVLEFGSPSDLLSQNKVDGVFARMVDDTGDSMSKSLREKASFYEKKDF